MSDPYLAAQRAVEEAERYAAESRTEDVRYFIPKEELNQISFIRPAFGFQPQGLAAHPIPDLFFITNYGAPAVIVFKLTTTEEGDLEMEKVEWIGWAQAGDDSLNKYRLFPTEAPGSGARRAQLVSARPDGALLVGRNGEVDGLTLLEPPPKGHRIWRHNHDIDLGHAGIDVDHYVDALFIDWLAADRPEIWVLRNKQSGKEPLWLERYELAHNLLGRKLDLPDWAVMPNGQWIYGAIKRPGDPKALWFVTDVRSDIPKGIYRGTELVVPGVTGNGMAFAGDGALLVTQYNEGMGAFGTAGRLLRVPPHLFP